MESKSTQNCNQKNTEILLKDSNTHFVDYSFGSITAKNLEVSGAFIISGITTGNPVNGATVKIPKDTSVVIIQNTVTYTQLSFIMPLLPKYGQTLSIVSTVNITNFSLIGSTFGTTIPRILVASTPLRLIFAGSWFAY